MQERSFWADRKASIGLRKSRAPVHRLSPMDRALSLNARLLLQYRWKLRIDCNTLPIRLNTPLEYVPYR
jgi:hypothetical protein